MRKVLILKLASLGDLVHALPALSDAAKAIPEISFDWVVDKNFQEIPLMHPSVQKVIPTNHRTWRKKPFAQTSRQEFLSTLRQMKETEYDCVIDAQGNIKSALLSLKTKGPVIGWDSASVPEWGSHFLYKKSYPASKSLHAIEKLRLLFAQALNYPMPITPPDYQIAREKLIAPNYSLPSNFLLFVPITSLEEKLWNEESWKECIEKSIKKGYTICIPWGSLKEKERAERLAIYPEVFVLPRLSLFEVGYVISKAKAMLSLDTGLSHMAASLDIPNVTLYGPTNPNLIGTIGKNQFHIQSTGSLKDLSSLEVWQQFSQLL